MSKVYLIRCVKNDTHYIGSTTRPLNERYREHLCCARKVTKLSLLYSDMRLYGESDFEVSILEELPSTIDRQQLIQREQHWIDYHRQNRLALYNKNAAFSDPAGYEATRYRNKYQGKKEHCECGASYCPTNRFHHRQSNPHQQWEKNQLLHLQPDCL